MTRYEQMAGTPERFAKFVADKICMSRPGIDCEECTFFDSTEDICQENIRAVVDWLNEEVADEIA